MKKKYNFLENVKKVTDEIDKKEKNIRLGQIISSLQQPMKEVVDLIVSKQIKDVQNLILSVKK